MSINNHHANSDDRRSFWDLELACDGCYGYADSHGNFETSGEFYSEPSTTPGQ